MSDSERTSQWPSSPDRARTQNSIAVERAIGYAARSGVTLPGLVDLLRALVREVDPHTRQGACARLLLAQKLLSGDPSLGPVHRARAWECARLCRDALQGDLVERERALAFALSGLSYSVLECFRAARHAYYRAVREDPGDPIIAHNLGHLLAARFDQPRAAMRWLRQAYGQLPSEPEIAASYAHVLAKLGDRDLAVDVLSVALGSRPRARRTIEDWISRPGVASGLAG
jgi:tetratricopeptide (TPR) repeat protein